MFLRGTCENGSSYHLLQISYQRRFRYQWADCVPIRQCTSCSLMSFLMHLFCKMFSMLVHELLSCLISADQHVAFLSLVNIVDIIKYMWD